MKTERKSALFAGIALLIMTVAAAFAFGYAHSSLVVPDDSDATFRNIMNGKLLFKTELLSWVLIVVCDTTVALALYFFFRNENRELSATVASLRIIYSAILAAAIFELSKVTGLLSSENAELVMQQIGTFERYWSLGLIIFGMHLFLLGILAIRSALINNLWGAALIFAGVAYTLIHASKLFFPVLESQLKMLEMVLGLPMAFAEIGFAVWLITRGGKPKTIFSIPKPVTVG